MRSVFVLCMLVLTGLPANAKLTPDQRLAVTPPVAASPDQWSILPGPAGAMLESDYFRAPNGPFNSRRVAPCRLDRQRDANGLRLAYSCH